MRRDRGERGSALIFALVVLAAAASLGALMLERGQGLRTATAVDRDTLQAFYAAEGGLAYARHALGRDPWFAGETIDIGGRKVLVSVDEERGRKDAGGAGSRPDHRWRVVVSVRGARLDATLEETRSLPEVVEWRINRPAAE